MKKLIAFAIVALIAVNFAFADGTTWASGDRTGVFTATVECTPSLIPLLAQNITVGTFFNDGFTNTLSGIGCSWNLKGSPVANYTLTNSVSTDPTGIVTTHGWTGDWTSTKTGAELGLNCTTLQHTIAFTMNTITIDNTVAPGPYTWTVTVSVAASL